MKSSQAIISCNISEFKAKCLKLVDETYRTGKEYLITKKGIPVAKVVPLRKKGNTRRGLLKGLAQLDDDIVSFDTSKNWEVLQ